jgi:CRISPR/Cas system-associated exonuclease Cas4 (RecB family)
MNDQIKNALNKLVEYLQRDLNTDYLVVGSIALNICGFPMNRGVHDIDIEIVADDRIRDIIQGLAKSSTPIDQKQKDADYQDLHQAEGRYDFDWMGVKVNAWLVKKIDKQYIWKDYIKYATVKEVLKVKLKYGRSKDLRDLAFATEEFFGYVTEN